MRAYLKDDCIKCGSADVAIRYKFDEELDELVVTRTVCEKCEDEIALPPEMWTRFVWKNGVIDYWGERGELTPREYDRWMMPAPCFKHGTSEYKAIVDAHFKRWVINVIEDRWNNELISSLKKNGDWEKIIGKLKDSKVKIGTDSMVPIAEACFDLRLLMSFDVRELVFKIFNNLCRDMYCVKNQGDEEAEDN